MMQAATMQLSRVRGLSVWRYAVGAAAVVVVVLLRLALTPVLGDHFRFMMLLPAVVFSAWYGGLGAGLLATGLSVIAAAYFWLEPTYTFAVQNADDLAALSLYLLVGGFISLVSDNLIQARRRLENSLASLRDSEERFRTLFELAGVGKAEVDLAGRFLHVNRRMQEITGYTAEELRAMSFIALTHPEDREGDLASFRQLSAGHLDEYVSEKRYCRKDASVIWVHVTAALSRDLQGNPRSSIVVVYDVTDRKRAEHALEQRACHAALAADIGVALTSSRTTPDMLQRCTEAIVARLDAAFARIWTCDEGANMLELQASAGMYTHLDGPHSRMPVGGNLKIGLIAATRKPHLTNAVIGDPHISDQDWARCEGIVAFAGYPLVVEDRLIGVMGMFARAPLADSTLGALGSVADEIALGIERRRTETALRASEERFRAIFDSVNDAIFVHDIRTGAIRDVNRRMCELYGWTPEQARQLDIGALSSGEEPYDQQHALELIARAAAGTPQVVEWHAKDATGRLFWVEVSLRRASIGGEDCMLVAVRDITDKKHLLTTLQSAYERLDRRVEERTAELAESNALLRREMAEHKLAERARRESDVRFAEFMQHLPGIAFMKDAEGRYVWVNPTFERIFHRTLDKYVGRTDDELWPAAAALQFRQNDEAVLRTSQALQITETVPHDDGLHHWLATKFPILNEDGGPRLVAGIAIDITERMRTEAQLREVQKLAQQRERLADIGAITAQIVHDLGNPLAGLSMQAQLVMHRARRDECQPVSIVLQPLERILSEVRRLDGRIKEFMEFSREQRLVLKPIDITRFLQEIVDVWEPVAESRGIMLTMAMPSRALRLTADDEKLRRVLDNLIKNAIEAIERGPGHVDIEVTAASSDSVCIAVSDTGSGIPETVQPFRLFETTKANGSGLGLAVVKQIVLAHGGRIEFSRRAPRGTVFRIELPRGGPAVASEAVSSTTV